jgi:hypothetical protein
MNSHKYYAGVYEQYLQRLVMPYRSIIDDAGIRLVM